MAALAVGVFTFVFHNAVTNSQTSCLIVWQYEDGVLFWKGGSCIWYKMSSWSGLNEAKSSLGATIRDTERKLLNQILDSLKCQRHTNVRGLGVTEGVP